MARTARVPRPARARRTPRARLPVATRLRRGPRPPDATEAAVVAAYGTRQWGLALLALAWLSLARSARRGVAAALPPDDIPDPVVTDPERQQWPAAVLTRAAALAAAGASVAVILARLADWVHAEHARLVMSLAVAGGSSEYLWMSRGDEKVRLLHTELHGTRQRWDDPPVAGTSGWRGHPGEAAGCRCSPWPLPREK